MTLDEALARIAVLEAENAALRAQPKPWWRSRYLVVNGAAALATVLAAVLGDLPPSAGAWIVPALAGVNAVLRLTSTVQAPLTLREPS